MILGAFRPPSAFPDQGQASCCPRRVCTRHHSGGIGGGSGAGKQRQAGGGRRVLGSPHGLGPLHSSGRYPLLLGHAPPSWALVGFVFIFYIIMICSSRELLIHTEAKARWGFVLPGGQGVLCWAEGSRVGAGLLLSWTLAQARAPTKVQEEQALKGLWTEGRVQRPLPGAGEGRAKAGLWRGQLCRKHGFFPWAACTTGPAVAGSCSLGSKADISLC